jgi:hypothetical protein
VISPSQNIESWPIEQLVEYARNPRKNDGAVDRMCGSIREFGFKIPCLVRSDGEIVDGHLRLKAARKLGITEIPVILCDEWTPAQVKAFRLMVNRSVTWADWDEELLALELQEIQASDFDLTLTGFNPGEIDDLLALDDEERANATPPLPEIPVSRADDLWLLGPHRVICGDATSAETAARLLGERKPRLMVTDPPYGIELDSEWRDRAGLNGHGPAKPSYMKKRTQGHNETSISGDTRADWSDAFALVPSLEIRPFAKTVSGERRMDGDYGGRRTRGSSRPSAQDAMSLSGPPSEITQSDRRPGPADPHCAREGIVIQGSYEGIEIKMELHQLEYGAWRCEYTLIRHLSETKTVHHGNDDFPTMELARESGLHDARLAIDEATSFGRMILLAQNLAAAKNSNSV